MNLFAHNKIEIYHGETNKMVLVKYIYPHFSPFHPCTVSSDFAQLGNSWAHLYHCAWCQEAYVTVKVTCSMVHLCSEIVTWSQVTLCNMPLWASPWKPLLLLHKGYIEYRSYILWGYVMATLRLLCQPGERFCYGCLSLFPPTHSHFACAGLSRQCDQQDSWHHEHYQQYTAINWKLVFGYAACRVLGPQPGIKIAPLTILITGPLGHLLETH